jgi:hypothetical protein
VGPGAADMALSLGEPPASSMGGREQHVATGAKSSLAGT